MSNNFNFNASLKHKQSLNFHVIHSVISTPYFAYKLRNLNDFRNVYRHFLIFLLIKLINLDKLC